MSLLQFITSSYEILDYQNNVEPNNSKITLNKRRFYNETVLYKHKAEGFKSSDSSPHSLQQEWDEVTIAATPQVTEEYWTVTAGLEVTG